MKISNILSSVAILFLVTACTTKTVEINNPIVKTDEAVNNSIETIKNNTQVAIEEKIPEITMNSNELEFLEILKNDNYASLCGSKDEYLNLLTLTNGEEKSEKLAELFYTYTNNLSNSCIDQKSFKKELKKRKYKDANQDYEVYNVDIDKKELLKKFSSNTQSVESILETYTPKHPQFFALIKKLDDSSLSQSKINKLRLNIERLKLL